MDEFEALKEHNEQLISFIEWMATQHNFALTLAQDVINKPDDGALAVRLERMRDEWAKVEIPWQRLEEPTTATSTPHAGEA